MTILKPKYSGSDFYNYKGFYSVVLLAADVEVHGQISDGGVLRIRQCFSHRK